MKLLHTNHCVGWLKGHLSKWCGLWLWQLGGIVCYLDAMIHWLLSLNLLCSPTDRLRPSVTHKNNGCHYLHQLCVFTSSRFTHINSTCTDPCEFMTLQWIRRPPYHLFIAMDTQPASTQIKQSSFYFAYWSDQGRYISIPSSAWWVGLITTIFSRGGQSCCHNDNPAINRIMMLKLQPTLSRKPGKTTSWPVRCGYQRGGY